MNVTSIPADVLFRVYTACAGDPATLILDVRPQKEFKKKHILGAYSIRLAANGKTLLDYSKNTYDLSWSHDCWWDKHVVVYGEAKLKKDHPVINFLAQDKHAKSVNVYKDGLEVFEGAYPFLVTASTKANAQKRFPGEIVPGLLYLGDWEHAQDYESLDQLKIKRIITIHNNPENLKPPARFQHMQLMLADVETEDVSQFFRQTFDFVEQAKAAKQGVLVHCGAGVSRSAAICIAYLMRKLNWSAEKAKAHCVQRRSIVMPNNGFWRSLCAFEAELGIQQRSDPTASRNFHGIDAPAKLAEDTAGEKVVVTFIPAGRPAQSSAPTAEDAEPSGRREPSREGGGAGRDRRRDSERERDRSRERRRSRSRDRGRHNDGQRRRSREMRRSASAERRRKRDREGDREARDRPGKRPTSEQAGKDRGDGMNGVADEKAQPAGPAPVVLETSKEGKVLGRLEIGLLNAQQRCVFGRLPSSDVVLEHLSISRQHAQLMLDPAGGLTITDLGAAHRTNVDGVWIRPNQARSLKKGSVFRLGGSTREFKVVATPSDLKAANDANIPALEIN